MQAEWKPTEKEQQSTNLWKWMQELGFSTYHELYQWSIEHRASFWEAITLKLQIHFQHPPHRTLDISQGIEHPRWFPEGKLNIIESCFQAHPETPALLFKQPRTPLQRISYSDLRDMTLCVAGGLVKKGCRPGDRIAVCAPMSPESVALYLGIIAAGCVVVSLAESFSAREIAIRLRITQPKFVFTQEMMERSGKQLPLSRKLIEANASEIILLFTEAWKKISGDPKTVTTPIAREPHDHINILFSSGTTGDPKAIPWNHTTPIKAAADGYLHLDLQPGNIAAWPTSLGWMMGPWLLFATLINRGTIALFSDSPTSREFCEFVEEVQVTMLGVVPSIVKAWRATKVAEGCDWSSIKCFSSTGECSNAEDYAYLMQLAGNRSVIEYCGGTEIGGGYLTGTLLQRARPTLFTTPALGMEMEIINGEVFLIPPSIGLSTELINADHHEVYYAGVPKSRSGQPLRRHGDEIEALPDGTFQALGRADDTMNLGGIKTSSAEIERALSKVSHVVETAAIAVTPQGGGPSELIIYAVLKEPLKKELLQELQQALRTELNPLFKISDLVVIDALPRTASNKVMRRVLRDRYTQERLSSGTKGCNSGPS